jgi:hypothetical protein
VRMVTAVHKSMTISSSPRIWSRRMIQAS